jgi:hypothetical protein
MKFTVKQIEVLSKIFVDFGKIIFATIVVGNFLPKNLVVINYTLICVGLLFSAISMGFGIFLLKGIDNK